MKKHSYKIVVQHVFVSDFCAVLSGSPSRLDLTRVVVFCGKKEEKSYYLQEHKFADTQAFDAFIGRLCRWASFDIVLSADPAFLYITQSPSRDNEIASSPVCLSQGDFLLTFYADYALHCC